MSLLGLLGIYELGLEVFKYLHLNDIDNCRLVCREMRYFVDHVVCKYPRFGPKLELEYKREKWMSNRALTCIPIDYTCDQEPGSPHEVEFIFVIFDRLIVILYTAFSHEKHVLTFERDGTRVASISFEGAIEFTERTTNSLLIIREMGKPALLWNCETLAGFQMYMNTDTIEGLGSANDTYLWIYKECPHSKVTVHVRHPDCIYRVIRAFEITTTHEARKVILFDFSSKWIFLQYNYNDCGFVELFDNQTGESKYIMPDYKDPKTIGRLCQCYIETQFITENFALLDEPNSCVVLDLETLKPIEEFKIEVLKSHTFDRSARMSNRFVVIMTSKKDYWSIWIGDLQTRKQRTFRSPSGERPVIDNGKIIDGMILVLNHTISNIPSDQDGPDANMINGNLYAYDLSETNEERFWSGRVDMGIGRVGNQSQEIIGKLGGLKETGVPNLMHLMRLPTKPSRERIMPVVTQKNFVTI